jgi:type I restriction enzyme S subunit
MKTLKTDSERHKRYWISTYAELKIPLPPLDQQKKIAAILDAADGYRQKTKALITKYEELTQSLFLDMFGDPGKKDYVHKEYSMDDIAHKITDGDHATPKRTNSGYKLLSCRNVKQGYIDFKPGVDFVGEDEFNRMVKRCNPVRGDILISCSGTIGRTTSVKINEPFVLVRSAALIKPNHTLVNSLFLEKYLQTPYMQAVMKRKANTSSQANLFTGPIKSLPVLLPELELQKGFAERIQAIEAQKTQAQASLVQAEDLFNSLLQKAFKGELS